MTQHREAHISNPLLHEPRHHEAGFSPDAGRSALRASIRRAGATPSGLNRVLQGVIASWILTVGLWSATLPLQAQNLYLAAGRPDGVALLAPPPEAGSEEEAADLASARAVFKGRTPAEEARAKKDAGLSLFLFTPAAGPALQPGKLPKTEDLFSKVKKDIGDNINAAKNHWKRQRPYQLDSSLSLGAPETSYGYPSGHSTRGTVYSLVMAEVFPSQREAILKVGRTIGWDRVLIGKHFPTDIQAGRVLGQAIFRELMANPAFQQDLAAAKSEVEASQGKHSNSD